ncbi:MAG: glycoside hydrolase family 92 protein [Bacteroidia bacterium]
MAHQKAVRNSIDTYFTTQPGGIPGNDDTGTLSAWLLFSMMGFYPDCPEI